MAMLPFNAAAVEAPTTSYDLLPAGWYPVMIVASDVMQNRAGTGLVAKFEFDVIDGPHRGRKLWTRENVRHSNQQAEAIGQQRVRAMQEAVNKLGATDTSAMHGIPLECKVKVRPAGAGKDGRMYDEQNEIVGYRARQGAASPTFQQPAAAPLGAPMQQSAAPAWTPPASGASASPPWAKSA